MKMRVAVWSFLGVFALLLGTAQAASLEDLQKRFAERLPKLAKSKAEGKIGEVFNGYVEAVKGDAGVSGLLDDENADRRALYEIVAKKQNISLAKVAELNGARNFRNAKPGEWLKGEDGKWTQKK